MLQKLIGVLAVLFLFAASTRAADAIAATVVSYDKDTMKLVVKIDDKEKTFELNAKTHVHDVDDKEIKAQDRPAKLKKGTKIEIEEKNGKVVEINLKK